LTKLRGVEPYVIPGDKTDRPRADLKRPWGADSKLARLSGVHLHDLQHAYASFGAGIGLGLPIIGKLLGHTQASTTQRYDPLRRATEHIGSQIVEAVKGKLSGNF
jgi:integrase